MDYDGTAELPLFPEPNATRYRSVDKFSPFMLAISLYRAPVSSSRDNQVICVLH